MQLNYPIRFLERIFQVPVTRYELKSASEGDFFNTRCFLSENMSRLL